MVNNGLPISFKSHLRADEDAKIGERKRIGLTPKNTSIVSNHRIKHPKFHKPRIYGNSP